MHAIAAAGSGFLVAVLWFDLMFDVQARQCPGDTLPAEILASISAYYRRVTTEATPMNRLVSAVMALTVLSIVVEIAVGARPWWIDWASLAVALSAVGLAGVRIVPNAKRLGQAADSVEVRTHLARSIYREHLYCVAAMTTVLTLQLVAAQN